MSTPPPRPRQVTLVAWMVMLGSAFVVVTVFEMVSGLRSLETREAIDEFLSEPPGSGMGLDRDAVTTFLHVAALVAAGCATASGVLGFHVLRRHRQARLALTILAGPLFVSGLVTGGLMSSLVAAASITLWMSPAREWFNGEPLPDPASRRRGASPGLTPAEPGEGDDASAPPPAYPRAQDPAAPFGASATLTRTAPRPPARRPDALLVAALLTWVFGGIVLVSSLIGVTVMAGSPELLLEELQRQSPELADQGVTESTIRVTTFVTGGLFVVWSAAAIVLAALALGRRAWARTALMVLAGGAAAFSVVATLGSVVAALPALASIAAIACLRRPEVRAWFRRQPD